MDPGAWRLNKSITITNEVKNKAKESSTMHPMLRRTQE